MQASGSEPLSYQWRFGDSSLAGATSTALAIQNVQPANIGSYSVVVTNVAGAVTSSAATLSLYVPRPTLVSSTMGVIAWEGLSNLAYRVEASTNFGAFNWVTLDTVSSATSQISYTNTNPNPLGQLYRVAYP